MSGWRTSSQPNASATLRCCGPPRSARRSRASVTTVAELIRHVRARLKKAKVVFAHGTTDPVAEAAFLVGETLKIAPDRIETLARRRVTAAQQNAVDKLVAKRIET